VSPLGSVGVEIIELAVALKWLTVGPSTSIDFSEKAKIASPGSPGEAMR
jgi:hypothetical protein